ncbi:surface lipoprotein assembly modifier [Providencia rettgeri]|uniref:surface lipoprotein assembly modifier n=1 Tax=Providencia rettgeri TaxID=587 RepID=UPI0034E0A0A0
MRYSFLLPFVLITSSLSVFSANIDIDREQLLWQKDRQSYRDKSAQLPDDSQPLLSDSLSINFNGQIYSLENNVQDLGQAIYLAINHRQFQDVQRLLVRYQALPDADPLLVLFAKAEVAKSQKKYSQAIDYYQKILERSPKFLRIKLELARTYYEDNQNSESLALFNNLIDDKNLALPASVQQTIQQFIDAIENRISWTGSLSLGYKYNSNINQVPDKNTLWETPSGTWKMADPISASGLSFDASLSKIVPISGHHSLQVKGTTYGDRYPHEGEFSENTTSLATLYRFNNANSTFSVGPQLEFKTVDGKGRYHGIGGRIDGDYQFTSRFILTASADHQQLHYQKPYNSADGSRSSLHLTGIYGLTTETSLFLGADTTRVKTEVRSDDYEQLGVRTGFFSMLTPDIHLLALATYRESQFQDFNAMLNVKRHDRETMYFARLNFPNYSFFTFTPYTSYRFRDNRSSADVLYSYHQHEISIGVETRF